jgi:hypothetical protein
MRTAKYTQISRGDISRLLQNAVGYYYAFMERALAVALNISPPNCQETDMIKAKTSPDLILIRSYSA